MSQLIFVWVFLPTALFGAQPTVQPSSLSTSNVGSGTLSLTWNRGNGNQIIIVAKAGSAVDGTLVDGVTYTAGQFGAGTDLGGGNFVVFVGTGTSTLIQGLSAEITYHFAAYELSTGSSPDPDYLTTSPPTTSTTTSAALILYSFQSGDAETPATWTTDSSGETMVNSAVPGTVDEAIILTGRTVTVTTDNFDVNIMRINGSGTLALGTTSGHDYSTMSGTGLVTSSSTHPTVSSNDFATTAGGTFEYVTSAGTLTLSNANEATYNNLTIDNTSLTVALDLTVNGTLTLENSSTLTLGNNTTARAFSFDNITVNVGNSIVTNSDLATHTAAITGNVTNNGSIAFTGQTTSEFISDPTVGVVVVTFSGTDSQSLSCGGTTNFFRIIVDKGSNQTATLTVTSTSNSNFRIYGRNDQANTFSGDDANPTINKALSIQNGTISLGSNIALGSLTEGGDNFFIPENGALHINGANVNVSTSSNGVLNQGMTLIGKLRISGGSYSGSNTGGIEYAGNASLEVQGGITILSQLGPLSTTIGSQNSLAFNQSAGSFTINNSGINNASLARFEMSAANVSSSINSFVMSGGTLTATDPNAAGGIVIITKDTDFSVTGGTIIGQVHGDTDFGITVTGALNNLTLREDGDGANGEVVTLDSGPVTMTSLEVAGNLSLETGLVLNMNNDDLTVGGNFNVGSGSTFTPGTNTLTFNGAGTQTFTMAGTITSLNNVTVNKSAGTITPTAAMTIGGDFSLTSGTFADGGFTHTVAGNVVNSGTHSGVGAISLIGTNTQTIGGTGSGVFQNLTLNNTNAATAPISTTAGITVNGTLTFSNDKLLSVGSNLFTFGSAGTTSGASSSRYIQTAGNVSDGGVSKAYASTGSFTWHIGASGGSVYTPATINVGSASTTGTINIVPVEAEHPNVTASGLSLAYYWAVTSTGFSTISNITHTYNYDDSDLAGGTTESEYIFGRFNSSNSTWTSGSVTDVNEATNTIGGTGGLSGVVFIDGDFTAGDATPTTPFGAVTIFYSRNDAPNITTTGADWDTDSGGNKTTWSTSSHSGSSTTQLPEDVQGSQVIIASGHIVDVTSNTKSTDGLELNGELDLNNSSGHDFGAMTSNGTLRISSSDGTPDFPAGNSTSFLGASGGTVIYSNVGAATQTLPASPTSYRNLTIEGGQNGGGSTINLPDANVTILNDLLITDGASSVNSATVNIPNSRTYSIGNDLTLSSVNGNTATLQFNNSGAISLSVDNDITIGSSTTIQVNDANGAIDHNISVQGAFTNNGTVDFVPSSGNNIITTFTGSGAQSITGTGATTTFGTIVVNKGSDATSELNVNATDFSLAGLTLTNGTFRLTSAQSVTVSTGAFTIPSTARLATSGGTLNVATGGDDANDVQLTGELEIVSGAVVVGDVGNNNNNDIEYSSTGTPSIDIQSGTLTVNGQIRRGTSTTAGNLTYSQVGGTVNINGRNSNASRAKLEVVNSGTFTMTNGTINIVRGGGTTFNDLYLYPNSSTVSGGTIDFTPGSAGAQSYSLSTDLTLNDVSVTGNGGSNSATLTLDDQALTVSDLTIVEANSSFDAAGFGLNINGNFTNSGTFTSNSNTTTFNGSGAQQFVVNSTTGFSNLVVNKTGTLTLSGTSDVNVTGDLTLTSGTMEDGGRTISVTGNVTNNATHTSSVLGTGGISFTDANHTINGSGTFGNITLNGTSRTITVSGVFTLNSDLDFAGTVIFDIQGNDLTFGSDATITGNSFSSTKMIRTASNNSIIKNVPASSLDFTFPIGISSNYTPLRTNLTANSATGTITIATFDVVHPLTNGAGNTELLRYWTIATTGLSGLSADLTFTYVDGDVQGTESNYLGGTIISGDWSPVGGSVGAVTAASNTISYTGLSSIVGEYTAGETAEFTSTLTYFSRATGDWETASTWSTVSHVGAAAGTTPNGNNVEISSSHIVTVTADNANANSLVLGGTLDLGANVGHTFGEVTGTGTMSISATAGNSFTFPSADISSFTGTVEYTGTTNGTLINTPSTFHNLTFSGTSTKTLQNQAFSVNNQINLLGGTLNHSSTNTLSMTTDFVNTGTVFNATAGTVEMTGTGAQSITTSGGGSTTFNNLTISNFTGTVSLNGDISVAGTLTQTAGTTFDMNEHSVGGTGTVVLNGEVQTSNTNGLSGGASTGFLNTLAGVTLNTGSDIRYDATGAQMVTGRTDYDDLEINGSGTKSMDGATTVASALNIATGDLSIGANTLTLNGTVSGAGTITGSTTSNLSIGGTGDAGTIDFSSGGETLGDLTVNRTSSGIVTFEESFTVNSGVTLTSGIVNLTEGTTVTVGASGNQGTITGGTDDIYFNTDPVDNDLDTNPDIDVFHEGTDITIPMGYNPFFSIEISCPTCSGHKFKTHIKRGPYNTPPNSNSRVTTNVVAAQWDLRKIQGGAADVTVTLCWSASAETAGLATNVGISVWNSNADTPFWDVGNNISPKTGSGPFCQTRTISIAADENQRFFFGVTNNLSPLPITLVSFAGAMNTQGDIDLDWQTADELNNDYYEVQRSDNGLTDWEGLDLVSGKGTSTSLTNYRYTDRNVNKDSGFLYYRLKQVDFNGTFDFSPVIAVPIRSDLFVERERSWTVSPNPSSGYDLKIVLSDPKFNASDEFGFRLFNTSGQMLYDTRTTGAEGVSALIDKLTFSNAGIYVLEIQSGDKVERHRLIKN